jgi:hypothetical protein
MKAGQEYNGLFLLLTISALFWRKWIYRAFPHWYFRLHLKHFTRHIPNGAKKARSMLILLIICVACIGSSTYKCQEMNDIFSNIGINESQKQMTKHETRLGLDRQKMRDIGRVLGFFISYL